MDLPIIVNDGSDVFPTTFKIMNQYLDFIRSNSELALYFDNAKNIVTRLQMAITAYWKGNIESANNNINQILQDTKKVSGRLIVSTIEQCLTNGNTQLYKARVGNMYPFKRDEMFHIPFNRRGIIKNQRYSINGIPCLYLGTSAYVCWEELGRPDFNKFWVSRFEISNKELKILNISYTLQDILFDLEPSNLDDEMKWGFLIDYCLFWIIECVCSISVINAERIFREEYVIPQLIMQNIRKQNIDGIMYFSVKGTYKGDHNSWIMKNLAFPADDYEILTFEEQFDNEKYKSYLLSEKLKKAFKLTLPLNMGLVGIEADNAVAKAAQRERFLNAAIRNGIFTSTNKINPSNIKDSIMLSEDDQLPYEYTKFHELETALMIKIASAI